MKYYKRLNVWKASNVELDKNKDAWSYGWWKFYDANTGIFNMSRYSASTTQHQYKVMRLLREQSLPINVVLYRTRQSLVSLDVALLEEQTRLQTDIDEFRTKLVGLKNKSGARAAYYRKSIVGLEYTLAFLQTKIVSLGLTNVINN